MVTTRTLTLGQLHTIQLATGGTTTPFFHFFVSSCFTEIESIFFLRRALIVSISFNLLLTGRRRRPSVDFYLLVFADLVFGSPQIVLIHSSAHGTQMLVLFFLAVDFSTLTHTQTVETFPP